MLDTARKHLLPLRLRMPPTIVLGMKPLPLPGGAS